MKIFCACLIISLCSGCISWKPCKYCHQNFEPQYEHNESIDMHDGHTKHVITKTWIKYEETNEQFPIEKRFYMNDGWFIGVEVK